MQSAQSPHSRPRFYLSRLTLIQKIAVGYTAMAFFTMIALAFSSYNIYTLNRTARAIATRDLPVINAAMRLRTSLLAQGQYAAKFGILKDRTFAELFRQRDQESQKRLGELRQADAGTEALELHRLYAQYGAGAARLFAGKGSVKELAPLENQMLRALDAFYIRRQEKLQNELERANYRQEAAIRWTIVISCTGFLLAIAVAPFVTYRTFHAIKKLQRATHRISEGDFDYDPEIPPGDEISDLARDFTRMAARLKELEQMNLDASPLTRLPGNFAIERELEQRLKSGAPFAFCYADLDNFKPFTDHYGYAKGSELLRVTGDLVAATVTEQGGPTGFTGHIGGDDFVMVLDPERIEPVCQALVREFDLEVRRHYQAADLERGGLEGRDRYGVHRFFPITTISIAVIMCDAGRFSSPVEIARAASEVKDSVKEHPGSSYLVSTQSEVPS